MRHPKILLLKSKTFRSFQFLDISSSWWTSVSIFAVIKTIKRNARLQFELNLWMQTVISTWPLLVEEIMELNDNLCCRRKCQARGTIRTLIHKVHSASRSWKSGINIFLNLSPSEFWWIITPGKFNLSLKNNGSHYQNMKLLV